MIFEAFISGVWGWLWVQHLTKDEEMFSFAPGLVRWLLTGSKRIIELTGWRKVIYKPLVGCAKCHGGWFYIIWHVTRCSHNTIWFLGLFEGVVLAMGTALVLEKIIK